MVLQRNAHLHLEDPDEASRGMRELPADGWVEVTGYRDGGGSCKHT